MKKLRIIFCFIISFILIFNMPLYVCAVTFKTTDRYVDTRYQDVDIKGVKPVVSGMSNIALQNRLNERIDTQYNNFIKKASVNTKKIILRYETLESGNYYSILFYCTVNDAVSSQNYVSTTVVDIAGEKILSLNDVIGPNGVKLINKNLAAKIAANPSKYIATFTGIEDNHDFYLDGDTVHITFGEFEISVGSVGIVEITLQVDEIKNFTIDRNEYRTREEYGIKMVPLRQIAEEFGYTVNWSPSMSIDILLNNSIITNVRIGTNSYYPPGGARRELESAPVLYDGKTYLPISFFEEILSISYNISPNGEITFSTYDTSFK